MNIPAPLPLKCLLTPSNYLLIRNTSWYNKPAEAAEVNGVFPGSVNVTQTGVEGGGQMLPPPSLERKSFRGAGLHLCFLGWEGPFSRVGLTLLFGQ